MDTASFQKSLSRNFYFALALLGLLAIISFLILFDLSRAQVENNQILVLSRTQRTYAQQIPLYTSIIFNSQDPTIRQNYRTKLVSAINETEKTNSTLIATISAETDNSTDLNALKNFYLKPPKNLEQQILVYINKARNLAALPDQGFSTDDPDYRYIVLEKPEQLFTDLLSAIESYEQSNLSKLNDQTYLEIALLVFILLSLVGVLFLLVRPALKKIEKDRLNLLYTQKELEGVLDAAGEAIVSLDEKNRILNANKEAEQIWGYFNRELVGKKVDDLFEKQEQASPLKELEQSGEIKVLTGLNKQGKRIPLEVRLVSIPLENRPCLILAARNIKRQLDAEKSLRRSEGLYRMLAKNIPRATIFLFDLDLRFNLVEGTYVTERTGRMKEEMEGKTLDQLLAPGLYEHLLPYYLNALDGIESKVQEKYGQISYEVQFKPLRDDNGEITGGMVFSYDITDQLELETKRRESEVQYRAAIEGGLDAFLFLQTVRDSSGELVNFSLRDINRIGLQFFRRSREELIGTGLDNLFPAFLVSDYFQKYKKVLETGETMEEETQLAPAGASQEIWIYQQVVKVGDGLAVTTRDITERKRLTEELQNERDFALQVLTTMGQGLSITDNNARIEYVNPAMAQLMGYGTNDLIGLATYDLTDAEHRPVVQEMRKRRAAGESLSYEVPLYRSDGNRVHVLITSVPRIRDGKVTGSISVITNLTDKYRVDQLKNEFVSIVSHELRTPLTSIRGSLGLIAGGVAGEIPAQAKTMINIAYNNSERLVRLINDILDIDKIESGKLIFVKNPVALLPLIHTTIQDNQAFAHQYNVTIELAQEVPAVEVFADADRIIQVLTNLLSNAIKFSPPGGKVIINTGLNEGCVRVSVCDYGPGIQDDFKNRIFQKFAQADSSDSRQKGGTGLGLSIAKAIIEKHGGKIGFNTEPGHGSTFYFELPVYISKPAEIPASPVILICEDDKDVATLLSMILADEGYSTDIAVTTREARDKLGHNHYSAMTLDIMLPEMNGITFLGEIRQMERNADIPIVVVSAKAGAERTMFNSKALSVVDWIDKPIDHDRLISAINKAIKIPAEKPRILHVEDDKDLATIVAKVLEEVAEVTRVSGAEQARLLLRERVFDLAILDLDLPDGSGEELIPAFNNYHVPVVIFSVMEVSQNIASKVAAVLVKTRTSNTELLKVISALVNKQAEPVS